jgi:hypothetical protein
MPDILTPEEFFALPIKPALTADEKALAAKLRDRCVEQMSNAQNREILRQRRQIFVVMDSDTETERIYEAVVSQLVARGWAAQFWNKLGHNSIRIELKNRS